MEPLESVVQPTSTDIFKPSEIVTNRTSSPSSSLVHILSGKFEMDVYHKIPLLLSKCII